MSPKHNRTPAKPAVKGHSDDDLEFHIRKGARRQRIFSMIVLGLLLLAFVATSAIQALPLLFHSGSKSSAEPSAADLHMQIHQLQELVRLHPRDEDMLSNLGNLQFDAQDFLAASQTYRKVLALDPGNPDVQVDYGTCLFYQQQPLEAIAAFDDVLQTHPRFVNAHVNLGVVYNSMGQQDKAAQEWHTAYQLTADPKVKAKIKDLLESLLAPAS